MRTPTDYEILTRWYHFAAEQTGFIDSFLLVLRERKQESLDDQQREFGVSDEAFLRLRGMRLPRSTSFASDAERIAIACQASNPLAFVRALVLARKLIDAEHSAEASEGYQAAFDEVSNLDSPPDTE
jgi:hypothetical protein